MASPPPPPSLHPSPPTTEHVLGPTSSEDQWKPSSQYLKILREAKSSRVFGAKPGSCQAWVSVVPSGACPPTPPGSLLCPGIQPGWTRAFWLCSGNNRTRRE